MAKRLIGVFDSGIGGLSVANAIEKAVPENDLIYVDDTPHLPYGNKPLKQIRSFVVPIMQDLVEQGCDVIVVACNTVTTNLIDDLRHDISVPLIGMEPMVKPAAERTKSGVIAICATPNTLKSKRYQWLKDSFTKDVTVLEPDCSDWTSLIESNQMDQARIKQDIDAVCDQGADVIVLGCTHYHWIENDIRLAAEGRAEVLQPEQPVIEQLKRVLAQLP